MSKVIVFGSLNMDLSIESDHMPQLGETIMGRRFIINPGGKGANQAVAAAKLGADVVMLGAVDLDPFGDQMIADACRTRGALRSDRARGCSSNGRRCYHACFGR